MNLGTSAKSHQKTSTSLCTGLVLYVMSAARAGDHGLPLRLAICSCSVAVLFLYSTDYFYSLMTFPVNLDAINFSLYGIEIVIMIFLFDLVVLAIFKFFFHILDWALSGKFSLLSMALSAFY